MRNRRFGRGLGGMLLLGCLSAALTTAPVGSAFAQEDKPSEAQLYFSNGVELLQQTPPNYQDAYNQFLLAYQKSNQSWKVLGNLGLCALNLERDGEAIAYYRKYLDDGGEEIEASERSAIEKELLLVSGNLAHVTFESKAQGVKFTVRREGSSAPARSYRLAQEPLKLGLRAGSYEVTAEGEGKKLVWEAVIEPGQEVSHAFDFTETKAGPSSAQVASPSEGGGLTTLQTTGIVTAGVGVAAVVGGLVTGLMAKGTESAALEECTDIGGGQLACPTSTQADFDSASSMATVSTALFIGGGVLAATGVTLFLVGGEDSPSEAATVRITPLVTWGGAGLSAVGRF